MIVESGSVLESISLLESGVSSGGLELLLPQAASNVSKEQGPTTAIRCLGFMSLLGAGSQSDGLGDSASSWPRDHVPCAIEQR